MTELQFSEKWRKSLANAEADGPKAKVNYSVRSTHIYHVGQYVYTQALEGHASDISAIVVVEPMIVSASTDVPTYEFTISASTHHRRGRLG